MKMGEWSILDEIALLQALKTNKPVGVNKHFAIVKLADELKTQLSRHVTIREVWSHLKTLYNLKALDEFETCPFPNEIVDFTLPEHEFPETCSEVGTESVADSLDLNTSAAELVTSKHKSRVAADKASLDDSTPKRHPKRTRASLNTDTPNTKRRRV